MIRSEEQLRERARLLREAGATDEELKRYVQIASHSFYGTEEPATRTPYGDIAKETAAYTGGVLLDAGMNLPKSTWNLGKETVKGAVGLAKIGWKALLDPDKAVDAFERAGGVKGVGSTMVQSFKDDYKEGFGETFRKDPARVLSDVAGTMTLGGGVLSGGAKALRGANAISKASKAQKIATALGEAADWVDPLTLGGKAMVGTGKLVRAEARSAAEDLGGALGVGSEPVKEAYRNPVEFRKAFNEGVSTDEQSRMVKTMEGAVEREGNQVKTDFLREKNRILKSKPDAYESTRMGRNLEDALSALRVKRNESGLLDFSDSRIRSDFEQQIQLQKLYDLRGWTDRTPEGLDALRQNVDAIVESSGKKSKVGAIASRVRDDLSEFLGKEFPDTINAVGTTFPGYATNQKKYADYFGENGRLSEYKSRLSLGKGADAETIINKIESGLRNNKDFKVDMLRDLEKLTNEKIVTKMSAKIMSSPAGRQPGLWSVVYAVRHPEIIPFLINASPKTVARTASFIGLGKEKLKPLMKVIEHLKKASARRPIQSAAEQLPRVPYGEDEDR